MTGLHGNEHPGHLVTHLQYYFRIKSNKVSPVTVRVCAITYNIFLQLNSYIKAYMAYMAFGWDKIQLNNKSEETGC